MILRLGARGRLLATPLIRGARTLHAPAPTAPPAARRPAAALPELITSPQNAYVKHCCKLRTDGSYRAEQGAVLLVGVTPLLELAQELPGLELRTLLWAPRDRPPPAELQPERLVQVTDTVLRKVSGVQSADGLDAVAELARPSTATDFCSPASPALSRLLVLDGVQDPGNLGTLLRTALALGWDGAFLLPGCCDPFNEKALRASRGAAFKLPLATGEWRELQPVLAHHRLACLAAEPGGESAGPERPEEEGADTAHLQQLGQVALVLGSEGRGLSDVARRNSRPVSVPMRGDMESLSVSQAGAILLFVLGGGLPELLARVRAAKDGVGQELEW